MTSTDGHSPPTAAEHVEDLVDTKNDIRPCNLEPADKSAVMMATPLESKEDSKDDLPLATMASKSPRFMRSRQRSVSESKGSDNSRELTLPSNDGMKAKVAQIHEDQSTTGKDPENAKQLSRTSSCRKASLSNAPEFRPHLDSKEGIASASASPTPMRKSSISRLESSLEDPTDQGRSSPVVSRSPSAKRSARHNRVPVAPGESTGHAEHKLYGLPTGTFEKLASLANSSLSLPSSSNGERRSESLLSFGENGCADPFQEAIASTILHLLQLRLQPWMSETARGLQSLTSAVTGTNGKLEDIESKMNLMTLGKLTKHIQVKQPLPSDGPLMRDIEGKMADDNINKVGSSLAYRQMQKKAKEQKDDQQNAKKMFQGAGLSAYPRKGFGVSNELKKADKKTKAAKKCALCDGSGVLFDSEPCSSCQTHGFVHPNSDIPSCALGVRCINCLDCTVCDGAGLIKESPCGVSSPLPSFLLSGGLLATKLAAQQVKIISSGSSTPRSFQMDGTSSPKMVESGFQSMQSLGLSVGSSEGGLEGGTQTADPETIVKAPIQRKPINSFLLNGPTKYGPLYGPCRAFSSPGSFTNGIMAHHRHLVQFYDTVDYLYDVLGDVFIAALNSGNGVFMASTLENINMVQAKLTANGFDMARLSSNGTFSFVDSKLVLAKINEDPEKGLDARRFFELADDLIVPSIKAVPKLVVYGDIVNTLASEGLYGMSLAKDLEHLWNELQSRHDFVSLISLPSNTFSLHSSKTLICGYDMGSFEREGYIVPFQDLCHCHDHAEPLQPPRIPNSDPTNTQILMLEQKVRALTFELNARKTMESFVYDSLRVTSKKAIESQKELSQCFGQIIAQLPVGLLLYTRNLDGEPCVMANKVFLNLMGCTEEEALGQDWLQKIHPNHRNRVESIIDNRQVDVAFEYCIGEAGCSETDLRWLSGQTHASNFNQKSAFVHSVWDVTSVKKMEAEKSLAKIRELMHLQRVNDAEKQKEQLNEFVDSLCHELRNPLNGILGNVELLQGAMTIRKATLKNSQITPIESGRIKELLAEEEECIAAIKTCASHSKVVADDILALSKLDANKISLRNNQFYPKVILAEVALMLGARASSKGVKILVSVPDEDHQFHGDSHRLRQVLINLVSNAIVFTQRGTITLSYSVIEKDDIILEPRMIRVAVEDTGVGLNREEQLALFERFSQPVKAGGYEESSGSGLGLLISKKLVELMGGTISVSSVKGSGSTFSFTIAAPSRMQLQDSGEDPPPSYVLNRSSHSLQDPLLPLTNMSKLPKLPEKLVSLKTKTVLVVEDNQKVLQKLLVRIGYKVLLASDGIEALEMYKAHSNEISIIFMDIQIPRLGGIATTQEIRSQEESMKIAESSRVRIVGISGNARQEIIDVALGNGMNGYLTKPWMKEDIYRLVGHEEGIVGV
ncbi:hypothetical protein HDU67_000168 [Dinochytrium kinnereticum]|nr:hypothetical protein HDU67_000168 [Dinochytrium kinnereticum]